MKSTYAKAAVFAFLVGCSSSSTGGSGTSSSDGGSGTSSGDCKAGANADFANPAGTKFEMPAGVRFVEATGSISNKCLGVSAIEIGSDIAYVCMVVENTTDADIELTLPAGLVFLAASPGTQNGITLQEHKIQIKAKATKKIAIRLSCINEHCRYTNSDDVYTLGNVVSHPGLLEIIELVKNKAMSDDTIPVTQNAVWSVTDHGGLTDEYRNQLKKMPNKT